MTQSRYLHDALVTEAMTKSWCTEPNALKIFVLVDTDTWKIVEFEGKKLFFPNEMAAKQWYSIQHTGDVFEGDAWAEHNIEAQSVFDHILDRPVGQA